LTVGELGYVIFHIAYIAPTGHSIKLSTENAFIAALTQGQSSQARHDVTEGGGE
jgi:hypothetical protein